MAWLHSNILFITSDTDLTKLRTASTKVALSCWSLICGWAMGMHAATILDCAPPLSARRGKSKAARERDSFLGADSVWRCGESHAHAHGERKREEEGRGFPRGDLFLRPELESGEKEGKGEGGVSPFCATLLFALLVQCRPPFSSGIEFPLSTLFIQSL